MMHSVATAAALALLPARLAAAADLGLTVSSNGRFAISLDGKPWLSGGETQAGGFSSSAKTLAPSGAPSKSKGTDKLGDYEATTIEWSHAGDANAAPLMQTSFRTYAADPSKIVFEQFFKAGLEQPLAIAAALPSKSSTGLCRVTVGSKSLHSSSKGFTAYLPVPGRTGAFEKHAGEFCDCQGNGRCTHWAYHTENTTLADCQQQCTKLNCSCFDWGGTEPGNGGHGHGSAPAAQTIFPGFDRTPTGVANAQGSLDCFSYHGVFPQMEACTLQTYKESGMGGVPLVIYDANNASLPMTVFSPLNQPMAHHMGSGSDFFGAGIKASVTSIPAGWSQLFILSAGTGINDGMMAWGDKMLKWTGKPRADPYRDLTHSTIGFWTDNGGYYHYATGEQPCKPGNCTSYETVLPKVKAYHDSLGVPFRHWQFDSWFYPKDGGVNAGGGGGAVTNWTADPNIFPSGMVAIQEKLKVPMVMHNRQWSIVSDYIKTGCQQSAAGGGPDSEQCEWYKSKRAAVPMDPINFFTWFFTQQDGWGLTMYEQDWMCTEYEDVDVLQTNISMGDLWLKGMADGAASSNRSIQYCMPYANQVLSAAAYPAVTNARATGDYFHGPHQWAVGGTSLFYWAIGILPFKDGFYSSTNKQVGGQTVGPEKQPDREALMATLSCAMVGPMDGINLLNATRTMTACRKDGYILKPDRPVSTTDACFRAGKPTCYTYHTYSDVQTSDGHQRVHYLFDSPAGPITADMVYLKGTEDYVVYNWYTGTLSKLAPTMTISAGYEGNSYAVVSPVGSGGWAFIGEVDKYVPASTFRFPGVKWSTEAELSTGAAALTVSVSGVAGEHVKVCAANGLKLVCQTVTFTDNAQKTVSFPPATETRATYMI